MQLIMPGIMPDTVAEVISSEVMTAKNAAWTRWMVKSIGMSPWLVFATESVNELCKALQIVYLSWFLIYCLQFDLNFTQMPLKNDV